MLSISARDTLQIRHADFHWDAGLRLLYASDLHLTHWTPHIVEQLDNACRRYNPDILLLGGDMVDTKSGLPLLAEFITRQVCDVWAVEGNHDEIVGLNIVRDCVETSGGRWLEESILLKPNLSISSVCVPVQQHYAILCTHNPAVFPQAVRCGYDLVLAGHLHGGQCVLAQYKGKMYPAGFFFRWNGDCFKEKRTTMLVSKGMNDTLPIRWNCPREVILCSC